MVGKLQRLDPDRQRRRLQLLAQLADVRAKRDRMRPIGYRRDRVRELIALRRRFGS